MATMFDEVLHPTYTRDGKDGFPPENEFDGIVSEYIAALNPRKREKALMTQAMYDSILAILVNPNNTRDSTAQFRFWTKKMFRLVTTAHAQVVIHENRPVAVKEQIYDVLVQCHAQCSHGGRDKTSNQVRRYYSWIPKELIARFVKACPMCQTRRFSKVGGGGGMGLGGGMYSMEGSLPPSEAYSSDSCETSPSHPSVLSRPPSAASQAHFFPPMPAVSENYIPSEPPAGSEWANWVHATPPRHPPPHENTQIIYNQPAFTNFPTAHQDTFDDPGLLTPRTIELLNSWFGGLPPQDLVEPPFPHFEMPTLLDGADIPPPPCYYPWVHS